jgi:HK97 family phage major capsid protein
VTIPKQTAAATAYWDSSEAAVTTTTQPTFGQISLTPKNVSAYSEVSRQLLLQSSPGADQLVMNDLAAVVARAVDLAMLTGTGAAGQPMGILNTTGVGSITGTSLNYPGLVSFQTTVLTANALVNSEAGGYVATPTVAGLLAGRNRFANTDTPLWQNSLLDGTVAGYPAMSSMQVPTGNMIFGDWSQVILAEWGALELELNPYANFPAGIQGIRAFYTVDVGIRWAASFAVATAVT